MTLAQATSTFSTAVTIAADAIVGLLTTGTFLYGIIIAGAIYLAFRWIKRIVKRSTRL